MYVPVEEISLLSSSCAKQELPLSYDLFSHCDDENYYVQRIDFTFIKISYAPTDSYLFKVTKTWKFYIYQFLLPLVYLRAKMQPFLSLQAI